MGDDLDRIRELAPPDPLRAARVNEIERRPATIASRERILAKSASPARATFRRARPILLGGAASALAIGGVAWWAGTRDTTGPTRIVLSGGAPASASPHPAGEVGVEAIVKVLRDGRPSTDLDAAAALIRRRAELMLLEGATVDVQRETGSLRVFVPNATATRPSSRLLGEAGIRIVDVADLEIGSGPSLVASADVKAPNAPPGGWFVDGYGTFPASARPPAILGSPRVRLPAGWNIYRAKSIDQARLLGASKPRLANVLVGPAVGIGDEAIDAVFRVTNAALQRTARAQLLIQLDESGRNKLFSLFNRQRRRAATTGTPQFFAIVAGRTILAVRPTPTNGRGPLTTDPFRSVDFRFAMSALALTGGSSLTFDTVSAMTVGQTASVGRPVARLGPEYGRGYRPGSIRELASGSTEHGPWRVIAGLDRRGTSQAIFKTSDSMSSYSGVAGCGTGIDSPLVVSCTWGGPTARDAILAVGATVRSVDVLYGNGDRRRYSVDGGFVGISSFPPKAISVTALSGSGKELGNVSLPAPGGYFTGP